MNNKKLAFLFSCIALIAFQIFNYSVTNYALNDVLGKLSYWPVVLSIAFCAIDLSAFENPNSDNSSWYLFGAWVLASAMNATLTWWGFSVALQVQENFIKEIPVCLAIGVFVLRVILFGFVVVNREN